MGVGSLSIVFILSLVSVSSGGALVGWFCCALPLLSSGWLRVMLGLFFLLKDGSSFGLGFAVCMAADSCCVWVLVFVGFLSFFPAFGWFKQGGEIFCKFTYLCFPLLAG